MLIAFLFFALALAGGVFLWKKESRKLKNQPDHDRDSPRNKVGRSVVGITIIAILFLLPISILVYFSYQLSGVNWFSDHVWILGAAIGAYLTVRTLLYYTVYVPIAQGLVTLDILTDNLVIYGPGLHFAYPWEQVKKEDNISLEQATLAYTEDFATKTDTVVVKFSLQAKPQLKFLDRFRMVGPSTVHDGFRAVIRAELTEYFANLSAEEALENIGKINSELRGFFDRPLSETSERTRKEAEKHAGNQQEAEAETLNQLFTNNYGVKTLVFRVEDLDFSPAVKEARAAKSELVPLKEMVWSILGVASEQEYQQALKTGTITQEQIKWAWANARVVSNNANESIYTIQGLEGTDLSGLGALALGLTGAGKKQSPKKR